MIKEEKTSLSIKININFNYNNPRRCIYNTNQ